MDAVIEINPLLCTGCDLCVQICEFGVLYIDDFTGLCKVRHEELCDKKGACIKVCEPNAIKIN